MAERVSAVNIGAGADVPFRVFEIVPLCLDCSSCHWIDSLLECLRCLEARGK
jgi:hypothetical protein